MLDVREKLFTVGEFIAFLNEIFKAQAVRVTGEVCELKRAASGHVYFTVKDKEDKGVLDCIIWSRNYELCGVAIEVGMELILSGHPNVYAPSGRLSFVADTVELVGEGALKKAYDALKKRLEAEGVFAPERKRPLPDYPRRIGVITSMKGAVIHDFQNNLGKFGFVISVLDSRVEGQQAAAPLMKAVARMRREAEEGMIDVLVVIRGGGSLESLQAFNNEALVRAIGSFPVPVIAGIGHDQDVPLVALAADLMTSTPTAAAHALGRTWEEAFAKLQQVPYLLGRIEQEFRRVRNDLMFARDSMTNQVEQGIAHGKDVIDYAERFVRIHDPRRQLAFGYSIMRRDGRIVRSAGDVAPGDRLETELRDGVVRSRVEPGGGMESGR
ncbi:MAG TPA: exodeoxyribonuclease VII large subunit [Candidatus Paceibacterota bacterium]|nr:exodeoxyribonuclease VII large subunit [Candidatus Paceibacterota bacterium]